MVRFSPSLFRHDVVPHLLFYFTGKNCHIVRWSRKQGVSHIEEYAVCEYPQAHNPQSASADIEGCLKRFAAGRTRAQETVVLVIPHHRVSSRYLRIPSCRPAEIADIVRLHIKKVLPYANEEIVVGWRVVETDHEGFSYVNIAFVQPDAIAEYLRILGGLGLEPAKVFLDVYGYEPVLKKQIGPDSQEIMIIALGDESCELAIIAQGAVCLSRSFALTLNEEGWQDSFIRQLMDTQALYVRQESSHPIKRLIFISQAAHAQKYRELVHDRIPLLIEPSQPLDDLAVTTARDIPGFPDSIMPVIGFILKMPDDSLNLVSREVRRRQNELFQARQSARLVIASVLFAFLAAAVLFRYTANKSAYAKWLDDQLKALQNQSRMVQMMASRLEVLRRINEAKTQPLDFFVALHQAVPAGLTVEELQYNVNNPNERFSLEGRSDQRELVFSYASRLNEFQLFAARAQVKYADSQDTPDGEVIKFRIIFGP